MWNVCGSQMWMCRKSLHCTGVCSRNLNTFSNTVTFILIDQEKNSVLLVIAWPVQRSNFQMELKTQSRKQHSFHIIYHNMFYLAIKSLFFSEYLQNRWLELLRGSFQWKSRQRWKVTLFWPIVIKVTLFAANVTLQVILYSGSWGIAEDVHFASNYLSPRSTFKSRYGGAESRSNLSRWGRFRSWLLYSINTQLKH
jgi:hypothetical protein